MTTFIDQFKAARRVSTPLIVIQTPDPASTVNTILQETNGKPVLCWDIVRGITPLSDAAISAMGELGSDGPMLTNPTEALLAAQKLPARTILFFFNVQLYVADNVEGRSAVIQAIWNLRDQYKQNRRTLVMLTPGLTLPSELSQDVLVLDEPLPDRGALREILSGSYKSAELPEPADDIAKKACDALSGLSGFTAEQVVMMSLTKSSRGVNLANLWERKRQTIERTPGLSVYRGSESFDDIGGVANAKTFLRRVIDGNQPPNVVLFIDEIEKALAGAGGDLSGTSQEMLGTLLSWMQDNAVTGIIAIGPPGCSKSMIAKATGNTAGVPTITFDLSGMKGSLVGESGKNLRQALKVVDAVSDRQVLCIATCNSIAALPPELRRRFTFGTFFFDLPDVSERKRIWEIYQTKYGFVPVYEVPEDEGWTGAEIRQCCDLAYRLRCSLKEAANYVVPVAKAAAESIQRLRTEASGRYISASEPGVYKYQQASMKPVVSIRRQVDIT